MQIGSILSLIRDPLEGLHILLQAILSQRNKKQSMVAESSSVAKFRSITQGIGEQLWIRMMLSYLEMKLEDPMMLYCDQKLVVSIVHNPAHHDETKHMKIDCHFFKQNLESGEICIPFVASKVQLANFSQKDCQVLHCSLFQASQ